MSGSGDQAEDRLYGLPLDEFTRARKELERELRERGEREAAEEVGQLRKPTVAAWALNQLVRKHGGEVRKLLSAGEQLRDAQEKVLAGGSKTALEEAVAAERDAVKRLGERAERLLREGGGRASQAVHERIHETLHASATDDELRSELERGRVTRERRAAVFGGLPAAPPARPGGGRDRGGAKPERGRREPERGRAKPERGRRDRLKAAREELRRLRTDAGEAERAAREAERRLQRAERDFREAEEALERARAEAADARDRAGRAGQSRDQAEQRVAELSEPA